MLASMRKSDLQKAREIFASSGGKAAAKKMRKKMTPEQISERFRRAANARWHPQALQPPDEPSQGAT